MLKLAVLVSGGGTNLQAIIDSIEKKEINASIATVVSNNQNARALKRAGEHYIDHICIPNKNNPNFETQLIGHLIEHQVDLVVLAGFLVLLPPAFIQAFHNRIINVHPSLIPAFCGKGFYGIKVHEKALEKGVKVTGATVHFVDEGADTGPIILQRAIPVLDADTPETLQKRVMQECEWKLLPQAISLIEKDMVRIEGNRVVCKGVDE